MADKDKPIMGWRLDRAQRAALLDRFPPRYADIVADHVTLGRQDSPPPPATAAIVGRADDGDGVEALVVKVDGTTDRPDGSSFHITWSLDKAKGRKAKESNDVIAERGWAPAEGPFLLKLEPGRW